MIILGVGGLGKYREFPRILAIVMIPEDRRGLLKRRCEVKLSLIFWGRVTRVAGRVRRSAEAHHGRRIRMAGTLRPLGRRFPPRANPISRLQ